MCQYTQKIVIILWTKKEAPEGCVTTWNSNFDVILCCSWGKLDLTIPLFWGIIFTSISEVRSWPWRSRRRSRPGTYEITYRLPLETRKGTGIRKTTALEAWKRGSESRSGAWFFSYAPIITTHPEWMQNSQEETIPWSKVYSDEWSHSFWPHHSFSAEEQLPFLRQRKMKTMRRRL